MTTPFQTRIAACTTLQDLVETLEAIESELNVEDERRRLEDVVDLAALPTFGGAEPRDTSGIWSWDNDDLLVTNSSGWFEIVARETD